MSTTVIITRAHFKSARPRSIGFCPVALALKSAGIKNPIVNRVGRRWYIGVGNRAFELPKAIRKVAVAFDYRKPVRLPVAFDFPTKALPNLNP